MGGNSGKCIDEQHNAVTITLEKKSVSANRNTRINSQETSGVEMHVGGSLAVFHQGEFMLTKAGEQ